MSAQMKKMAARIVAVIVVAASLAFAAAQNRQSSAWDPKQETERDSWGNTQQVLDALDIRLGSRVADIGAGNGYFTSRISKRIGLTGRVYAVEINDQVIQVLRRRVLIEMLQNVEIIRGDIDNPRLPDGMLDAIIVVNAYHEMEAHQQMLQAMKKALRFGGRLGIIDRGPSIEVRARSQYTTQHRIPEATVKIEAIEAGFTFGRKEPVKITDPTRGDFYFLTFMKVTQ